MQVRIVVYQNEKKELCVPIAGSGAGIGRDAGNPVQLSSPEVSKRHALVQKTAQGWCVLDLDSRNGLFVNGSKVKEAILQNGDRLMIGPYTLVFEIEQASQPYTPVLRIDVSANAERQTMLAQRSRT